MKLRLALPLILAALTACGDPTGPDAAPDASRSADAAGVTLRVDRGAYTQGSTARVVLRNGSGETIGYNLCSVAFERRVGDGWSRSLPLRLCVGAFFPLAPGEEAESTEPVTAEWRPGEYRIVTWVHRAGGTAEVRTPVFAVMR